MHTRLVKLYRRNILQSVIYLQYWQNKVTKQYGFTHISWQFKCTSSEQHTTTSHSDIDLTKVLAIIANFLILKSLLSSSAIVYSNSVCAVTGLSSDQSLLHPDCVITMEVLSTGMHLIALVVHVMILVLSMGLHLKTVVSYWDVLEWLTFSYQVQKMFSSTRGKKKLEETESLIVLSYMYLHKHMKQELSRHFTFHHCISLLWRAGDFKN